ncbi:MAG TPA: DUF1553 domain-containing protein, partial [Verrucomicrobiae bacterium]|nr:DUF1553 domain-containing protein [Verrucomicrobiae bacterium]
LLPNATVDQRVATGFLRNSMQNQEGGIEPEKFRVESMIDRLDAVGRTWLGLTVACAQCHSHKYDPISQKEYYQFYAFLNQDVEPKLEVLSKETETKRDEIRAKARALEDKLMTETPDLATRMAKWEAGAARLEGHWQVLDAKEWHITPMKFEKQEDLSLLGGGDIYNNGVLRVWVDTQLTNITGFRLEALNHPNLPFGGPGIDGNGQFELCEFSVEATPLRELVGTNVGATNFTATTNMVKFIRAEADAEAPGWEITKAIDGDKENGGWATDFTYGRRNQERRAVFEAEKPLGFEGGTRLLLTVHCKPKESKLSNFLIGHVRLSLTTDVAPLHVDPFTPAQRKLLAVPVAQRTPAQQHELFNVWRQHEDSLAGANKQWDELWRDWPAADSTTLVMQKRSVPRVTRIFRRGDYLKPTTEVEAGTPAVLHPLASGSPRDRLGLARWIVDTRNPLTPRVIVNRVWQQYFGAGLVLTPEDFGTRAEPPSHPELLDWLAGEFMRRGWSQKELHRLIVMSATYRQSSRVTPELLAKDPYNRLLARGPRFRLDAEEIQDVALKAAGLLSPKIGGPSVFPPLPDGVMQMSYGPIPWNVSEGEDRYRRAMYTFWKRSVPYPAMVTFDAPTAEQSCVRRARSDTPLQALITLNETSFNNAARWLAWRTLSVGGADDKQRVVYAFRQCLARKPERREMETLLKLLDSAKTEFAAKPKEAGLFAFADPKNPAPLPPGVELPQLAAWSTVTRAILNLDETVTKE